MYCVRSLIWQHNLQTVKVTQRQTLENFAMYTLQINYHEVKSKSAGLQNVSFKGHPVFACAFNVFPPNTFYCEGILFILCHFSLSTLLDLAICSQKKTLPWGEEHTYSLRDIFTLGISLCTLIQEKEEKNIPFEFVDLSYLIKQMLEFPKIPISSLPVFLKVIGIRQITRKR